MEKTKTESTINWVLWYKIIAALIALISFVRHWEESGIIFNLIMSSIAGLFWPIYLLVALFN